MPRKQRKDGPGVLRGQNSKKRDRICSRCFIASDTVVRVARHSGSVVRQQLCPECLAAIAPSASQPALANRTRLDQRLRRFYGIGTADYEAQLVRQDGRCAICRCLPPKDKRFDVDHCHETGAMRGLLCDRCNRSIGLLEDDGRLVLRAGMYLMGLLDGESLRKDRR